MIGFLIRLIYSDDIKTLDTDLDNTAVLFIFSSNFYERNKETLSTEAFQENLKQVEILISNFEHRYSEKGYLPKYKVKLIQDIRTLIFDINYGNSSSEGYRISFEALGKVGFALKEMKFTDSNSVNITENEYKKVKDILLEYEKRIDLVNKKQH